MEYSQKLQEHNIWLTVKTIVVIGFVASFLGDAQIVAAGMFIAGFIILFADSRYTDVNHKLKGLRTKYRKAIL